MTTATERQAPAAEPAPMRFGVSHAATSAFVPDGLRTYFEYRDLGVRDATDGRAVMLGGIDPYTEVMYQNPDAAIAAGRDATLQSPALKAHLAARRPARP
jgi:hypothetical protein